MSAPVDIRPMTDADMAALGMWAHRHHGLVGVRRGAIVAYGVLIWGRHAPDAPPHALFGVRGTSGRPWWLPIVARRFLAEAPADHILAHEGERPDVSRWLTWLGFTPAGYVDCGYPVWEWRRGA